MGSPKPQIVNPFSLHKTNETTV